MRINAKFLAAVAIPAMVAGIGFSSATPASAQVAVFTDEAAFTAATGAAEVPIPNAADVFSGAFDCGSTAGGQALGDDTPGAKIEIDFGSSNTLTIQQDPNVTSTARGLCIFDAGNERSTGNMDPSTMDANTIVGNGEDDYILTFETPVHAAGFRLITNEDASETFTFFDTDSVEIDEVTDGALDTSDNRREFVGFKSTTAIASILIDTTGGAGQNEGIDRIKVAADFLVNINVHPGSDPNPLNLSSGGSTPVAIFGTADFDVTDIDPSSLTLADAYVKTVGKSEKTLCNVEDIGSFDADFFDNLDPDLDGHDDLVCHFVTANIGDLEEGENLPIEVTGYLTDGTFVGSDVVKVVKEAE